MPELCKKVVTVKSLHLLLSSVGEPKVAWYIQCMSLYLLFLCVDEPKVEVKLLWKSSMPLKCLIHTWLIFLNELLTVENLAKRGRNLHKNCVLCDQAKEITDHIFHIHIPCKQGILSGNSIHHTEHCPFPCGAESCCILSSSLGLHHYGDGAILVGFSKGKKNHIFNLKFR